MRLRFPNAGEPLSDDVGVEVPKVVDRDRETRRFLTVIDLLGSIGQKRHPQHRMTRRQLRGRVP